MSDSHAEKAPLLTFDVKPRTTSREAIKPRELIQVSGHSELTLNARRAITLLWHNAHAQGLSEGRDYTIEIDDLKPDGHKGYEMVEEAVEALMRTILIIRHAKDGSTRRVQFLGGNDLDSPQRAAGVLTYSFDKKLIEVLQDSSRWGQIALPVLMAFTSKYAVSLYENMSQFRNLSKKSHQDYTLDEFRNMLGVPPGRYKTFGELNKHVVKPAADEVNALAPFGVTILPIKQGKKVVQIKVGWWAKEAAALKAAFDETERSKVGRRARISGTVEHVSAPLTSNNRLVRTFRLERAAPKTS